MEQNRTKLTLVNLAALLVALISGWITARLVQSFAAYTVLPILGAGVLVALVSYFLMRLVERERLERLEYDELKNAPSGSALFEKDGAELLPAQRSRRQFEKYFVPGFAVLLLGALGTGTVLLWRWMNGSNGSAVQQPMLGIVIFAMLALVLFLLGRYSVALARMESQRLLQPVASFVLAGAYLCAAVSVALIIHYSGFSAADRYAARALIVLLGILATETLLTLILEVYRPRVSGKQLRLLYDSRVIGLLAQPESLFTTAAQALDYQFGFAVSQTRAYKFLQKGLAWIIAAQVLLVIFSTAFVVIDTGEEALLERFGRPVESRSIIGPGFHVKWPWPIDQVRRYRTDRIQTFKVGLAGEEDEDETVLWTVSHSQEEFNLIVASRELGATTNADGAQRSPPVNLLSVGIPVQFQITNLFAWAYNNVEPDRLLEKIATREVVRYLVSADVIEIMSSQRGDAAAELQKRIQSAANERNLGAHILFVGLQDIHPPVKVAHAYERVVGAMQSREAKILSGRAQAEQTNALATATAYRTVRNAEADRDRISSSAAARGASLTNQIPAYRAAPEVYMDRAYLQVITRNAGNTRKYVIATTNTDDIILFNLEDKLRTDLLDIPAPVVPPARR